MQSANRNFYWQHTKIINELLSFDKPIIRLKRWFIGHFMLFFSDFHVDLTEICYKSENDENFPGLSVFAIVCLCVCVAAFFLAPVVNVAVVLLRCRHLFWSQLHITAREYTIFCCQKVESNILYSSISSIIRLADVRIRRAGLMPLYVIQWL